MRTKKITQVFEDYITKEFVILIILSCVLISPVAAAWGAADGASGYALFLLIVPFWMLVKMRREQNEDPKKRN